MKAKLSKVQLSKLQLLMFTILSTLSLWPLLAAPASSPPESRVTDAAGPQMDAPGLQAIACEPGVVVLDIRSNKDRRPVER